MTQFKGTPGPWEFSTISGMVKHREDGLLASVNDIDEQEFNGNLIAAAPKLLMALQAMVSKAQKQNWNANYPVELQQAVDAINEALGGK